MKSRFLNYAAPFFMGVTLTGCLVPSELGDLTSKIMKNLKHNTGNIRTYEMEASCVMTGKLRARIEDKLPFADNPDDFSGEDFLLVQIINPAGEVVKSVKDFGLDGFDGEDTAMVATLDGSCLDGSCTSYTYFKPEFFNFKGKEIHYQLVYDAERIFK